ncbi:MAG: glycosyltransferase family 4 protein [Christensenellaceae bacterium]|jgi:glycosyltransferase involved in cell wall biosynthesis
MAHRKKRICFVVQRYGRSIVGGAEMLARGYVNRLKGEYDIDVLTSCATDYNTWKNVYAEGKYDDDGVGIYRFASERKRNDAQLVRLTQQVYGDPYHDLKTAAAWLREVGPYCPGLLRFIKEEQSRYDAFIFVGYHYYTATCCMPLVAEKSIFVPTAHDEEPLRKCNYFKFLFNIPRAIIYLTDVERDFVQSFFRNGRIASAVVGSGVDIMRRQPLAEEAKFKYALHGPYIVYTGRIDESKNCNSLVEMFLQYKERYGGALKLLLVGEKRMDVPLREDISCTGFVEENEKLQLLGNAKAFVMPSENESLSISLLEAMACGVPTLVNGRSEVLKGHIEKSNSGLYYKDSLQFMSALAYLLDETNSIQAMCENGVQYVRQNYNWQDVIKKLCFLIDGVCSKELYLCEDLNI